MHRKPVKSLCRCPSRKVARTKQDARQDLVKAVNSRGSGSTISHIKAAYLCQRCGFWHLTRSLPWFNADNRALHLLASDVVIEDPDHHPGAA